MRPRATLLTKAQVFCFIKGKAREDEVPGKPGAKLLICHARTGEPFQIDLEEIEATSLKSDSGERLWRLTQSSREGREFDERVNEAHVLAYREKVMTDYRESNLRRNVELEAIMDAEIRTAMASSCAA